jgi:5-methyltetrahydrofolate--homocysteine methyltransferase
MDQLVDEEARDALLAKTRDEAAQLRDKVEEPDDAPPVTDDSVRSKARTDVPIPTPPFWGVREMDVDLDEVYPYLDRHVLFTLHWGGRGLKREEKAKLIEEEFQPRLERMWREQDYLRPRALIGYFPCNADGNELIVWDPEAPGERELERLVFPRQPKHDRICLADYYRPVDSGEVDVCVIQAVTVGPEVTDLIGRLEKEGEFAEQLYVHGPRSAGGRGHGRVAARAGPPGAGHRTRPGRRYSWGYPACPDQSEHEKVFRLLGAESIGLSLSGGYAVSPEQSTVAIVAHHPQAVYFGMKSGFVPEEKVGDELIAGTERGGELPSRRLGRLGGARDPLLADGHGRRARARGAGRSPARTASSPGCASESSRSSCSRTTRSTRGATWRPGCGERPGGPEESIWTSALATAGFLEHQRPGGTAFVIGEAGSPPPCTRPATR